MATSREILFRKSRKSQYIEGYKNKIKSLLINDNGIEFLSLEDSDNIRFSILGKHRNGEVIDYKPSEITSLIRKVKENKGKYFVFIDDDWEYCGAFFIENLQLIRDDFTFKHILNNVVLIRKELNNRIEIDFSEDCGIYNIEYSNFNLS